MAIALKTMRFIAITPNGKMHLESAGVHGTPEALIKTKTAKVFAQIHPQMKVSKHDYYY
jgi:hypothetical protein